MARSRPLSIEIPQSLVRWLSSLMIRLMFRVRVEGLENYPATDGFLLCSNHQSYLDPVVIGVSIPRPINFLARQSLFRFKLLGWFLKWNDTIAIDREASGIGGLKEMLRRLKRQESVLMFPEGTRSPDGEPKSLKLGFCPVARRAKSPLLPIVIDGAFQAWPRTRWIPLPGKIQIVIGKLIPYESYAELTDQEMADLLQQRMQECFLDARCRWNEKKRLFFYG